MNQDKTTQSEKILWQGRPAPRCYTFQYWKQALIGSLLFMVSSFWLLLAFELVDEGQPLWLLLLPLPIIVSSFIFGPMQLLIARWRWPKVFYQLTDENIYFSEGRSAQITDVTNVKIRRQGEHLASLRLDIQDARPLIIHCIEQPDQLLRLLHDHCPKLKV